MKGIPGRRALWPLVAVVSLWLLVGGVVHAVDEEASEREIEALRSKITASRERLGDAARSERDLLRHIQDLDQGLEALRVRVDRSRRRAEESAQTHARVEAERIASVQRLAATRRAMEKRAVALYKAGAAGPLQVLFASTDLPEMLVRMGGLERLLVHDSELVARSIRESARVGVLEWEADEARKDSDAAHQRLARRNTLLSAERSARGEALEDLRRDQTRERSLLAELEGAAQNLKEVLAKFRAERAGFGGGSFAARKGGLLRPVGGPVRRPFGRLVDPRYRTEIFHKGLEIQARRGDGVRAVAPGRVRLAGWFRGYGRLVIVDHGDGYFTVSGHLADIYVEVGDVVDEGHVLGTVGDTGSLEGPGLYFEVRRGSGPLNPAEWLAKG